jgi:ABC-type branched-subunit amino acid transport system ATPase component/branched-subunit amino acid ABC-type transport system permease component
MLPFIIAGLVSGSVYGLIGTGLVLTYRTSGIFNFAYGALATVAAYVYYFLHVKLSIPAAPSFIVAVAVLSPALGIGFERFAYRVRQAPLTLQVTATVGIVLIVESLAALIFGENPLTVGSFLPTSTFKLGGTYVGYDQLITFVISAAAALALYMFLRKTRMGKSMQGVVDNPELLGLAGTSPVVVRRVAWTVSCFLVTLSGVLLAPSVGVDPTTLTLLVLQGFGAAAIGAFTNISLAWVGGLVIGVASSLITKYVSTTGILGGLAASVPFIVVFVAIMVLPRRRVLTWTTIRGRTLGPSWKLPGSLQLILGAIVLVLLILVPQLVGFQLAGWTTSLTYVLLLLSLGLLVRTSGQMSLCQMTFAAIGVVAFAKLTHLGVPWLPALLVAGLVAVPIAALLAIPAIRLPGVYLAVATFGFGLLAASMFYQTSVMFGLTQEGVIVPGPTIPGLALSPDKLLYYAVLAITVIAGLVVIALTRTRLGRLLQGLSESPVGLAAMGTNVAVTRVLVFCVSAFLAAVAGALLGSVQTVASSLSYDPILSLTLAALIVITIGSEPWYALIAAAGFGLVPTYLTGGNVPNYLELIFGVFAVIVAMAPAPEVPAALRRRLEALGRALELGRAWRRRRTRARSATSPAPRVATGVSLELRNIRVQFGGLVAVDDVSLSAPAGVITGLIGPNGAGKTTLFNACSGRVRPTTGTVLLSGRDISRYGSSRRARHGLGRTFQETQLFDGLTVAANVSIGREASLAGANPVKQVITARGETSVVARAAQDAMELCGVAPLADTLVADLSTGERRLVELARCVAGEYDVMLLDEPSAGLDQTETQRVGEILRRIVAERGTGVLLVEHDMALVMDLCRHIYVLDFGRRIFDGTPNEIRESDIVRVAYLGSEAAAAA